MCKKSVTNTRQRQEREKGVYNEIVIVLLGRRRPAAAATFSSTGDKKSEENFKSSITPSVKK